jgi:threonine synthase
MVSVVGHVKELQCRECGTTYPPKKIFICEECFAPVDVVYDSNEMQLDKSLLHSRPRNLWRYFELLPISNHNHIIDIGAGFTPLHRANRLGDLLGLHQLFIKNDSVNPTFSFKDRPVGVAVSKALEFNAEAISCASTGNLAAASAAYAAKANLPCYVFIPYDIESNKILQIMAYGARLLKIQGTYDQANRIAMQVAETHNWILPNHNVRPYYVEGSKTLAFEVCEQLDWNSPDHVIVPTGSGALLCAISKGFKEFKTLNLIDNVNTKITCAQPQGSSPIVDAFKRNETTVKPIEYPKTIAKSLAIGDPGDGYYALKRIRESRGVAESVPDDEIVEAIKLLARTEGIFTEPAGGVTIAVLKRLVNQGYIESDETIVCYITGNGLKTPEALNNLAPIQTFEPRLDAIQKIMK